MATAPKYPPTYATQNPKGAPVILLADTSWWPCASRMAMEFQAAGCTTAAICPAHGHPLRKTHGLAAIRTYRATRPLESLANAIDRIRPDLIIPCDDRSAAHLHRLYFAAQGSAAGGIRESIARSLGTPSSFDILTNRFALMERAGELGIRIPQSQAVGSIEDLHQWSAGQSSPWYLKADGTWGGHGVRIANGSDDELLYAELTRPVSGPRFLKRWIANRDPYWWEAWREQNRARVMAQAGVEGTPANSAVACWQGQVLAQICVEVVESQGATGPATIVKVIDHPAMKSAAEKLAKSLCLSGIIGLDFILEQGTGDAYLIELNPRCTPLSHLNLGKGHDLVGALAAEISGRPARRIPPVTDQKLIAYFPQAWRAGVASDQLQASFHDAPRQAPELVRELLRIPWPDRNILARLSNWLGGHGASQRAARRVVYSESSQTPPSSIVPLRPDGAKNPLYLIHGVEGTLGGFDGLAGHLGSDRPVYAIQSQALQDKPALSRVEDLAAFYLRDIRAVQARGPYHFVGYSFGGLIAFEMARQLHAAGSEVGLVAMVDNVAMGSPTETPSANFGVRYHLQQILGRGGIQYFAHHVGVRTRKTIYLIFTKLGRPIPRILKSTGDINWFAARQYKPRTFSGRVTLLQASQSLSAGHSLGSIWENLAGGGVETRVIQATHATLFQEPKVRELADQIQDCMAKLP